MTCREACKHLAPKHNQTRNEKARQKKNRSTVTGTLTPYDRSLARAHLKLMLCNYRTKAKKASNFIFVTIHACHRFWWWVCGHAFVLFAVEAKGIVNLHIFLLFIPYLFCIFFVFCAAFIRFFYCKYIEAFFPVRFFYHISFTYVSTLCAMHGFRFYRYQCVDASFSRLNFSGFLIEQ